MPETISTTDSPQTDSRPKHDAVLEQAIRTFAELGFRGTDVQVIADRAGVGKGTVYRHFGNKEELFWAVVFEVLQRLGRRLLEKIDGTGSPIQRLRSACLAYGDFFIANPAYLEVFVQDRAEFRGATPQKHHEHYNTLIGHFVRMVEEGIAAGEFRPVDARMTITSLAGISYGTVVHSCYVRDESTLAEQFQCSIDIFIEGIRASHDG